MRNFSAIRPQRFRGHFRNNSWGVAPTLLRCREKSALWTRLRKVKMLLSDFGGAMLVLGQFSSEKAKKFAAPFEGPKWGKIYQTETN